MPCYYSSESDYDFSGCVVLDQDGVDFNDPSSIPNRYNSNWNKFVDIDIDTLMRYVLEVLKCFSTMDATDAAIDGSESPCGNIMSFGNQNLRSCQLLYDNFNEHEYFTNPIRFPNPVTNINEFMTHVQTILSLGSAILDADATGQNDNVWRDCSKTEVPLHAQSTTECDSYLAVCCQGVAGANDEEIIDPNYADNDGQGPRIEPISTIIADRTEYQYNFCEACPINFIRPEAAGACCECGVSPGEGGCDPTLRDRFGYLIGSGPVANIALQSCISCGKGEQLLTGASGLRECEDCPAGKANSVENTLCQDCDQESRQFSSSGLIQCKTCPVGKYTENIAASSPTEVPCQYCTIWEGVTCGETIDESGNADENTVLWREKQFCNIPVYETGLEEEHPVPVYGLEFVDNSAAVEGQRPAGCAMCQPGKYHNGLFHTHPSADGTSATYSPTAQKCQDCPSGKYSANGIGGLGSTTCLTCPVGKTTLGLEGTDDPECDSICRAHGVSSIFLLLEL